jgi:regulatory protein
VVSLYHGFFYFEMATITAIVPQKQNQERVNVHLDGRYAFSLALTTAAYLRLGQSLSEAEIENLQSQDAVAKARQQAMRFLSYRPRSVQEVRQNLQKKDVPAAVVEQTITYLSEHELLSDHTFAQYWVEQRETFKPRSHFALRQELQQKGVSREVIDEVLTAVDDTTAARQAAVARARQWAGLPEETFFIKMAAFLQRRGFNYSVIEPVIREIWADLDSDDVLSE